MGVFPLFRAVSWLSFSRIYSVYMGSIGQVVPHMTAILNLVAAELGVSIVPASMMQVRVTGIAYRQIARQSPTTWLALAYRRGETSPIVRNFVARAVS